MSVMPEQRFVTVSEPVLVEQESLVFAAASILKEMSLGTAGYPVREVVSDERRYRLEGHRLQTSTDATGPIDRHQLYDFPQFSQLPSRSPKKDSILSLGVIQN